MGIIIFYKNTNRIWFNSKILSYWLLLPLLPPLKMLEIGELKTLLMILQTGETTLSHLDSSTLTSLYMCTPTLLLRSSLCLMPTIQTEERMVASVCHQC